jgi:thioesterase domain-containing protein
LGLRLLGHPAERALRRVTAANTRAIAAYVPAFYPGKITLFLAGKGGPGREPDLGWGRVCGDGVEVHEVPGTHSSMLNDEATLRPLAGKLADCLRRSQGGTA